MLFEDALQEMEANRDIEGLVKILKGVGTHRFGRRYDSFMRGAAIAALKRIGWKPSSPNEQGWYFVATDQMEKLHTLGVEGIKVVRELGGRDIWYVRLWQHLARDIYFAHAGFTDKSERSNLVYWIRQGRLDKLEQYRESVAFGSSLLYCLLSDEVEFRRGAARIIGDLGDENSVMALLAALGKEREWTVRRAIVAALGKYPKQDAVKAVLEVLATDSSRSVRREAAKALGVMGDVSVLPVLHDLLGSRQWLDRWGAAVAVAQLGNAETVERLKERLGKEANVQVRAVMEKALEMLG